MAEKVLDPAGKELVKQRILAGDAASAINARLRAAGYPELTDQGISYYRNLPEVAEAIAERKSHLRQIGLGERTRRFEKLNGVAQRLERRMMVAGGFEEEEAIDSLSPKALFHLDRYFVALEHIRKEVGDDKLIVEGDVGENSLTVIRELMGVKSSDKSPDKSSDGDREKP